MQDLKLPSVLWKDATLHDDYELLVFLADKALLTQGKARDSCVEKMFKTITSQEWQRKFNSKNFVFCLYCSFKLPSGIPIDLKGMLSCQAIEDIYSQLGFEETRDFSEKLKSIFQQVYNDDVEDIGEGKVYKAKSLIMNPKTANVIRIIRNMIAHTGSIWGNGKLSKKDKTALEEFRVIHKYESFEQAVLCTVSDLNYLTCDIILRLLGLEWRDLSASGAPPQYRSIFNEV